MSEEPEDIKAIRRARDMIVADATFQRSVADRAARTAAKLDEQADRLGLALMARGANLKAPETTQ